MTDAFGKIQVIVAGAGLFLVALALVPVILGALNQADSVVQHAATGNYCILPNGKVVGEGNRDVTIVVEDNAGESDFPKNATEVKKPGTFAKDEASCGYTDTGSRYSSKNKQVYLYVLGDSTTAPPQGEYLFTVKDASGSSKLGPGTIYREQSKVIARQIGFSSTIMNILPLLFLVGGLVAAVSWIGAQLVQHGSNKG